MTTSARVPPQPGELSPRRVTKRRAETRARLLDAAFEVFAAKGFGEVRIEDVCAAAGYSRGAFYSQFDSLDELFFVLYDERSALITQQITDALATPGDDSPLQQIDSVAAALLLDRAWLLIKTDFLLYAVRHPNAANRLAEHREALRIAITNKLEMTGVAATCPTVLKDVHDAARAVVAAYDGVTIQLLLDGDEVHARQWLAQLLTALLRQ